MLFLIVLSRIAGKAAVGLKRTAGNLGTNLLTAALAGTASGLTSYIGAGGKLFGKSKTKLR